MPSYKNLTGRLLRRNISAAQLAGYAVANFVGLAIVMCAVQFYRDAHPAFDQDSDSFINRDYLVISPSVSTIGTITGTGAGFTPEAVADLERQPWTRRVGEFTNADFNISASIDFNGGGMQTFLFFESIPDEFFDIRPSGWSFDPESPEIPIIVSKDYLALYNFGFASSRGLPQLSENVINKVPLRITVAGNGRIESFPGRIVGFSSRFNTIAVPQEFMQWANARFADPGETRPYPSRLIVEVENPGSPQVRRYMESHGYEIAGDKADSSRASYFLSVITGVIISVGAVISLLSFFILVLSLSLLLQKNRRKLTDLMLLGYSPNDVAKGYLPVIVITNAAVLVCGCIAVSVGAMFWKKGLESASLETSSLWPTWLLGAGIIALITLLGYFSVLTTVRRYFHPS